MNCKSTREMLSAYLDRELTGQDRDAVRAHLVDCEACRMEERDLRALKGLLLGVRAPEPAADFEQRLMTCLREQAPVGPRFEFPKLRPLVWGQYGGLAVAAGLATFIAIRTPQSPIEAPRPAPSVATTVANNRDIDLDSQWSDSYFQASDLSAGPRILTNHGP